jgi:hypothetical protein
LRADASHLSSNHCTRVPAAPVPGAAASGRGDECSEVRTTRRRTRSHARRAPPEYGADDRRARAARSAASRHPVVDFDNEGAGLACPRQQFQAPCHREHNAGWELVRGCHDCHPCLGRCAQPGVCGLDQAVAEINFMRPFGACRHCLGGHGAAGRDAAELGHSWRMFTERGAQVSITPIGNKSQRGVQSNDRGPTPP